MNSNALTEAHFIVPLEQHYETKAKPGVRLTILNELNGLDEVTLGTAAEFIKRHRKAMTFPSPVECLDAVKQCKSAPVAKQGEISGANYASKAAEYAKASGRKEFPVIHKWVGEDGGEMTPKWKAWQQYWEGIGARSTLALIHDRKSWTVPTEWPQQFDLSASWASEEMQQAAA